jgi:hypothetical protein
MYLRKLIVAAAMLASLAAFALRSVTDVEAAIGRGDYAAAEQMTREEVTCSRRSNDPEPPFPVACLSGQDLSLKQIDA